MLHKLNAEIQARLRSGVAITSVAQCVEELVLNSIDARATCVAVRVDMSCCKIQVVDNGIGMSHASLEKVAERYTTSKCHTLQDLDDKLQHFGYRGEALASIRDISAILEIESRAKQSTQTFTRTFQYGKPLSLTESKTHRPSAGTTLTVHDLFHCLPVRRKALNESLELERIRQRIEAIALVHPSMSLSLRNDAIGTKVLQTHKSNSVLGAFTFLFGNAKARLMHPVSAESDSLKVNGFVGIEGHHSKALQFVFVNDRLVLKTKIHKSINYFMSKSSITKRRYAGGGEGSPNMMPRNPGSSPPKSTSERHGMFVLNVTCPLSDYDITYDPAKTLIEFKDWRTVRELVESMIQKFLVDQNLMVKDPREGFKLASPMQDADDSQEGDSQEDGSGDQGSTSSLRQYAVGINTANTSNNLSSEKVSRPNELDHNQIVEEIIAKKSEEEKQENEETVSVEDEESIPGNCLQIAAEREIALTCDESLPTEEDTPSVDKHLRGEQSLDSSSPLAFMYKTSQEPGTSTETISKQPLSVSCESEKSPEGTMFSESPLEILKKKAKEDKKYIIISDDSSASPLSTKYSSCESAKKPTRVRDKTFISLDESSDASVEPGKPLRSLSPAKALKILKHKFQNKECAETNQEGESDPLYTSSLEDFQRVIKTHEQSSRYSEASKSNVPVVPSTSTCEEQPISAPATEVKSQGPIILSNEAGFESCLSSFQNKMKPLPPVKSTASVESCNTEQKRIASPGQSSKEVLNTFARIRKSLTGKLDEGNILNPSVIKITTEIENSETSSIESEKSEKDPRSSVIQEKSRADIMSGFSRIRSKVQSKESNMGKQSNSKQNDDNSLDCNVSTSSKATQHLKANCESLNYQDKKSNLQKPTSKDSESNDQEPQSVDASYPSTSTSVSSSNKAIESDSRQSKVVSKAPDNQECTNAVSMPTEITRKRRIPAATFREPVPLAAKLSRLSRGEVVPQPPRVSRVLPTLSMMDQMVEATRHALSEARSNVQQQHQEHQSVGAKSRENSHPGRERRVETTKKFDPCSKEESSIKEALEHEQNQEKCDNVDESDIQPTCESNETVSVESQSQIHAKSRTVATSVEQNSHKRGNTHNVSNVMEAIESYKGNLYKRPYSFSVTPRVPEWKKQVDISFLSAEVDDEEDSENDVIPALKRPKVQLSDKNVEPEKWKSDQLPVLEQNPGVSQMPTVTESDIDKFSPLQVQDTMSQHQPSTSTTGAPDEIIHKNKGSEVITENPPVSHQNSEDEEQEPLVTALKTKSKQEYEKHGDEHESCSTSRSGTLTIQALDYTLELEPLHRMAVPNMELGSDVDDDAKIIRNKEEEDTCVSKKPKDCDTTGKKISKAQSYVEPSQGFSVTAGSISARISEEESQGFGYADESQAFSMKADTQGFTPSPGTSSRNDEENTDTLQASKEQSDMETSPQETPKAAEASTLNKSKEPVSSVEKSPEKILFVGQSWICKLDPNTGKKIFINKITGHSSYDVPQGSSTEIQSQRPVFQIKNPLLPTGATPLLQAGSSPLQARPNRPRPSQPETESTAEAVHVSEALADHLENQEQEELTERGVKWRDASDPSRVDSGEESSLKTMLGNWENPAFQNVEQCGLSVEAGSSSRAASRVQQAIHPYKFTKDMFSTIKILGQVDNKFIACLVNFCPVGKSTNHELLAVIDQHAAHERVRLERLTAESFTENGACISHTEVDPEVEVTLKEEDVRVACAYRAGLEKKGILFRVENGNKHAIYVKRVPTCLVERDTNEKRRRRSPIAINTLELMIREETELLRSTHGACGTIPQAVFRELCSQACHGAIKFGDPLTMSECEALIKELSVCKLPFQCAHGRPSVMPILDLDHLKLHRVEKSKIQLWKLRQAQLQ